MKTKILIVIVCAAAAASAYAGFKCQFCGGTGWRGQLKCIHCGGDGETG